MERQLRLRRNSCDCKAMLGPAASANHSAHFLQTSMDFGFGNNSPTNIFGCFKQV